MQINLGLSLLGAFICVATFDFLTALLHNRGGQFFTRKGVEFENLGRIYLRFYIGLVIGYLIGTQPVARLLLNYIFVALIFGFLIYIVMLSTNIVSPQIDNTIGRNRRAFLRYNWRAILGMIIGFAITVMHFFTLTIQYES